MSRVVIVLLAGLLIGACSTPASPGLAGSEWRPVEIAGEAPRSSPTMFVAFGSDGTLRGNGGCNGFSGGYETDGRQLAVTPLAATRMACPEPAMGDENAFLAALQGAATFVRETKELTLFDDGGGELVRLVQTDWD